MPARGRAPANRPADRIPAALKTYRRMRDFSRTAEPSGAEVAGSGGNSFVIQKHAASHLHYDFRLELNGVLKSWAVAKGPSLDPGVRRLAIETEDHPLAYGGFEGTIPKGQYGGGTVMVWDFGTWEPLGDPQRDYRAGRLKFRLKGRKLSGGWTLVRMKPRPKERHPNWLLIKENDTGAKPGDADQILQKASLSAKTGRDMDAIAAGNDVWISNRAQSEAPAPRAEKHTPRSHMPALVEPELATRVDEVPPGDDWLHEIKFDGYRLQCRKAGERVEVLTRHHQDWTHKFPRIAAEIARLPARQLYLEGEAVVLDQQGISDFPALQATLQTGDTAVVLYAFDLLYRDGEDLRSTPTAERKELLSQLLGAADPNVLRFSDHQLGGGPAFFQVAAEMGVEGIISKRALAPYRSGRTRDWLKIKRQNRQEFVVCGYIPSTADEQAVGSLILGVHDDGGLRYVGKVGTGFTASSARALRKQLGALKQARSSLARVPAEGRRNAVWVAPQFVAEVSFGSWTTDRILRHAVFMGLREDKPAEEIGPEPVKTLDEVGAKPARKAGVRKPAKTTTRGKGERPPVMGIGISHPERRIYPDTNLTKLDVARYFEAVSSVMLPHVARRPLALVRCPDGVGPACFFQKHAAIGMPAAIRETTIRGENVLYIDTPEGLVALVQHGVLEVHVWGSRLDSVEQPDWIVMDFDPDPTVTWDRVVQAAIDMRTFMADLGLESFVKTTGGKGLHVVVPIRPALEWDAVKQFTHTVAEHFAAHAPDQFTTNMAKRKRTGRMFVDYLRNGRGATAIAPYSTRARPGSLIATPISWEELENGARPQDFTIASVPKRIGRGFKDPWAKIYKTRQGITATILKKLGAT